MQAHKVLSFGSLVLGLAVMVGAFGAHGLENKISEKALETDLTGVRYHFYHGFALMLVGLIKLYFKNFKAQLPSTFFLAGILLFSCNCYLYAMLQIKVFAYIVPLGGISFIIGWFTLAYQLKGLK
jgi:uncharacterized membrane protein YgdD (TMEM256/DUF423 family)